MTHILLAMCYVTAPEQEVVIYVTAFLCASRYSPPLLLLNWLSGITQNDFAQSTLTCPVLHR